MQSLGEVKRKSLKIVANFLHLLAILQDWEPKVKADFSEVCKS